jgi:hypothetical protein
MSNLLLARRFSVEARLARDSDLAGAIAGKPCAWKSQIQP